MLYLTKRAFKKEGKMKTFSEQQKMRILQQPELEKKSVFHAKKYENLGLYKRNYEFLKW